MATNLESETQQRYVDFDEYVEFQVRKTRSNIKSTDVLTALAGTATLVLAYVLAFVVFDHWVIPGGFSYAMRILLLSGVLTLSLAWIVWKVVLPYTRRVSGLFAASVIESSQPSLKSNLLNLIDLRRAKREIPENILEVMEKRAAVSLSQVDIDEVVDRRPLMRLTYVLLALVVVACLYTLFSPKKISSSVWRALFPAADVAVATRTEIFKVEPGDTTVLARSELNIKVQLRGVEPDDVNLFYSTGDRRFVDEVVNMRASIDGLKEYEGLITGENGRGILQDMTYYVVAGDARTEEYRITVIQPPSAVVEELEYQFPEYMGLVDRVVSGGSIDTWEGSKVNVTATANMPVKSAIMRFADTEDTSQRAEEIRMQVVNQTDLRAEWTAKFRSDGTYPRFYWIDCTNERGERDPQPTVYPITIQPDRAPEVVLLDPVRDLEMPANGIVPLMIRARDPDFLLRRIVLRIEKDGELLPISPEIFNGRRQTFAATYDFDLEPLGLVSGQTITYWVEARDNRQPIYNRRNTPRLNIRIVDAVPEEEVQEDLARERERQQEMLEEAEQNANETGTDDPLAQQPDSQPSDETTEDSAEESESTEEDQTGDSQQEPPGDASDPQAGGDSPSGAPEDGSGEENSQQNDPVSDEEAIERLYQHFQDQQQDPEGEPQPEGDNSEGQSESESQGDESNQDSNEQGTGQQPNRSNDPTSADAGEESSDSANETGGDGAEERTDDGTSDSSDGSPTDSQDPADETRDGQADRPSDSEADDLESTEQDSGTGQGERQPAESGEAAQTERATGNETGEATPHDDPNAETTQANEDITRKPGTDPTTRPNNDASPSDNAANSENRRAEDGSESAQSSPKDQAGDQRKVDERSSGDPENSNRPASERKDQPNGADEPMRGPGRPDGQKSDQPQAGEGGDSQAASEGTEGGDTPGAGDSTGQPGGEEAGESQGGNPDSGPGSEQKGTEKPGGEGTDAAGEGEGENELVNPPQDKPSNQNEQGPSSEESPGGSRASDQGEQSGMNGPSGNPGESEGSSQPTDAGSTGGGNPTSTAEPGQGAGKAAGGPAAEDPNLEFSKEAANLVLKRLQEEMKRGDVDEELLEQLGWTQEDMKKFSDRLQRQLNDDGQDQSPEAEARRRQFEESLKSLNLTSEGARRTRQDSNRGPENVVGPRRLRVPPQYREAWEAYTRELSKKQR